MKYCPLCGKELTFKTLLDGSSERYCSICDHVFFDSPSPAVIVAVTEADRVLLTRSVGWEHSYWGLVAGHVRSGETAEETAVREVHEEVGLEIFNLEILGTYARGREQLMIAFTAETNSDDIRISEELEKAAWFRLDEQLPFRPNSITSQIIEKILHKREPH